jgi:hypothetical protein
MSNEELKAIIHKMIDAISEKRLLVMIYTFIKYLK